MAPSAPIIITVGVLIFSWALLHCMCLHFDRHASRLNNSLGRMTFHWHTFGWWSLWWHWCRQLWCHSHHGGLLVIRHGSLGATHHGRCCICMCCHHLLWCPNCWCTTWPRTSFAVGRCCMASKLPRLYCGCKLLLAECCGCTLCLHLHVEAGLHGRTILLVRWHGHWHAQSIPLHSLRL